MSIEEYRSKRDFRKTPEPPPKVKVGSDTLYVIQRHEARSLHWDLRLEREGVLVSWAVPKEPPTEKGVRRLAIQTEDHPIEYATFEGCFEFYTTVITEIGPRRIGNIVNNKECIRVLSLNQETLELEFKPIVDWFRNGRTTDFLRIRVPGQFGGKRVVTVTPNHRIYTPYGLRSAKNLKEGDDVFVPGWKWTDEQYQILIGTLLGDAHLELTKETMLPVFQLVHSERQRDYLTFVRNRLSPRSRIAKRKTSNSFKFRFTDASLVNLYHKFYNNKKKFVNKTILDKLDERGLAIWYMDDGYLSVGKYVELCTQGFGKEGNEIISAYLNNRWEVESKVYYSKPRKKSGGGYFIHLSKCGSARFLTLINNYLLDELRYKTYYEKYQSAWKFDLPQRTIIPVRILSIAQATKKQIRSQQRYDIHVKDNSNYFAGPILVSNSIPEGEYGAGTVTIWDQGTYEVEKWEKDKEIIIFINGQRLKGRYCLIRFRRVKNGWLFFKCGD